MQFVVNARLITMSNNNNNNSSFCEDGEKPPAPPMRMESTRLVCVNFA